MSSRCRRRPSGRMGSRPHPGCDPSVPSCPSTRPGGPPQQLSRGRPGTDERRRRSNRMGCPCPGGLCLISDGRPAGRRPGPGRRRRPPCPGRSRCPGPVFPVRLSMTVVANAALPTVLSAGPVATPDGRGRGASHSSPTTVAGRHRWATGPRGSGGSVVVAHGSPGHPGGRGGTSTGPRRTAPTPPSSRRPSRMVRTTVDVAPAARTRTSDSAA